MKEKTREVKREIVETLTYYEAAEKHRIWNNIYNINK